MDRDLRWRAVPAIRFESIRRAQGWDEEEFEETCLQLYQESPCQQDAPQIFPNFSIPIHIGQSGHVVEQEIPVYLL